MSDPILTPTPETPATDVGAAITAGLTAGAQQTDSIVQQLASQVAQAAAPAAQPTPVAEPAKQAQPAEPTKPEDKPDELSELKQRLAASDERALRSEANSAALQPGAAPERVAHVLRLADLTGIDINAADAPDKIRAAVTKVLEEVPELKGAQPGGTGNPGSFARAQTGALDQARADFKTGLKG